MVVGKPALIHAIIGELQYFSGKMTHSSQSITYTSQELFLMDGTVKENDFHSNQIGMKR